MAAQANSLSLDRQTTVSLTTDVETFRLLNNLNHFNSDTWYPVDECVIVIYIYVILAYVYIYVFKCKATKMLQVIAGLLTCADFKTWQFVNMEKHIIYFPYITQ